MLVATHTDIVMAVGWHPNGQLLASVGFDGTLRIWSLAQDKQVKQLQDPDAITLESVAWGPDSTMLATGGSNGNVWVWPFPGDARPQLAAVHERPVWDVRWSPAGNAVASGGGARLLRVAPVPGL